MNRKKRNHRQHFTGMIALVLTLLLAAPGGASAQSYKRAMELAAQALQRGNR